MCLPFYRAGRVSESLIYFFTLIYHKFVFTFALLCWVGVGTLIKNYFLTFAFKDGTHGLKGRPWRKVDGRGRIGLMSTVLEGGYTYSLKNYVPGFREDTTSRWCATEVDDDGVMMPVGFVLA